MFEIYCRYFDKLYNNWFWNRLSCSHLSEPSATRLGEVIEVNLFGFQETISYGSKQFLWCLDTVNECPRDMLNKYIVSGICFGKVLKKYMQNWGIFIRPIFIRRPILYHIQCLSDKKTIRSQKNFKMFSRGGNGFQYWTYATLYALLHYWTPFSFNLFVLFISKFWLKSLHIKTFISEIVVDNLSNPTSVQISSMSNQKSQSSAIRTSTGVV